MSASRCLGGRGLAASGPFRGRLAVRLPSGLAALRVPVGEQPRHGDQIEVGVQLLLHQTLALAVELVDLQELLADLVHFLDAPAGMIQIRQVGDAVVLGSQQGGAQHVRGGGVGVLHEPQRDGPPARAGILAGQVPESVPVGQDAHDRVRPVAVDEAIDGRADVAGEAKSGVSTKFRTIWAVAAMAVEWSRRSSALHDC